MDVPAVCFAYQALCRAAGTIGEGLIVGLPERGVGWGGDETLKPRFLFSLTSCSISENEEMHTGRSQEGLSDLRASLLAASGLYRKSCNSL